VRIPFLSRQPKEPPRYLIVGLGNPGAQYRNTRHNVGFECLQRLAEKHKIDLSKTEKRAKVGYGRIGGVPVVLAAPQTYMNLSGESVAPLMKSLGLRPEDVIVIVDEMDLPTGRLRIRKSGSAGGHNGLKSLIQLLGTDEFPRIRIGVGRPSDGAAIDHVLGKFGREEIDAIRESIGRAAEAAEYAVENGVEAAMNRFNPKG
jgi:PTH1 family peptidyl-tRNA hydrolase